MENTWHGIAWPAIETRLRIRLISHAQHSHCNLLRLARYRRGSHSHDHRVVKKRLPLSGHSCHFGRPVLVVSGRLPNHSIPGFFAAPAAIFFRLSHVSQTGNVCLGICCSLFFNDLVVNQCAGRRLSLFASTNCE